MHPSFSMTMRCFVLSQGEVFDPEIYIVTRYLEVEKPGTSGSESASNVWKIEPQE
jgi:hypothetical protein